jgi:carbamoyl-phosphate synthase
MTTTALAEDAYPDASLVFSDGTRYTGKSFGYQGSTSGEVVFSTGMVGYPEAITDPSYQGQILVLTFPMIGNYGVPNIQTDEDGMTHFFESHQGRIYVAGLVVGDYCNEPSHWQAVRTLSDWLKERKVPAIFGVDTRHIVLRLRDAGSSLGKILVAGEADVPFVDPNTQHLVQQVSTKFPVEYGSGDVTILCLDMGIKLNTIRCFLKHYVRFRVVPFDWDITKETYDGLFISNGPGDPAMNEVTIANVRWALTQDKPIFGICMGNQVLALAAGAKTYKLKYGNRGQNQPCKCHVTGRVLITTQNHGFAVDEASLPEGWLPYYTNENDGSNEGIRHATKPFFSVQFHPEARVGPMDSEFLFGDFMKLVRERRAKEYVANCPRKVLVLGAGGISIGQAGEFDYSGSQCLKSLREEGIETVLVNPNIATVQTDAEMSDGVYFVPVTVEAVERVIEKEKPGGILLGWGGQTALNCGLELAAQGILAKHNVRVLGTPIRAIEITEDRELFRDTLLEINEHVAPSFAVVNVDAAVIAAQKIGYPVMVRAAFALGGLGSGICKTEEQLRELVSVALANSPQVLVEKSVAGWKEVEYEVVRDIYDNCITVCNMENFDPMGVHTGESIVVAPSQTLTNDEYHMLRSASIKIIRHLGVVGECNIQYGLNPKSHEYVVIEVNARLSRSSALASKATGYPLAHVAVKLALGKALPSVQNAVTKSTCACFEPSLDYCVVKVPRWDLNKFNLVSHRLGSMMKSVGEVMSIGRTFEEAFQKALRMVDTANPGFDVLGDDEFDYMDEIEYPTPRRVFAIAKAIASGVPVEVIHEKSRVDLWFLSKLRNIMVLKSEIVRSLGGQPASAITERVMRAAKARGFSDKQLASFIGVSADEVRARRHELGVLPLAKQIDTVSGEFPAKSCSYTFLSYNAQYDDVTFDERMVVVVGCGVYRIGNSVEFDYSGVLVTRELRKRGYKVLLINYNPETVSTDYDECDRLYFDEVSPETVLDVVAKEKPLGVIISVGGQIAQNMALELEKHGAPIWGTCADRIDAAEDRNRFSALCDEIKVDQPRWAALTSVAEAHRFCKEIGFPVLVRPSYVLSGSAMSVIWRDDDVEKYLASASRVSGKHPVVISKYFTGATEYDVDVVAYRGAVLCYSVCEHVENAGVHSGDATMFLPPQDTDAATIAVLREQTAKLALALDVTGPLNVQFLRTADGSIKVIEANLRSSRSIPFVSKVLGISFPRVMVDAFLGTAAAPPVAVAQGDIMKLGYIGCKASVFSFVRLAKADPILGVEMSSTGEVGVFGRTKHEAFLKALIAARFVYPSTSVLLAIDSQEMAIAFLPYAHKLSQRLILYATPQTATVLRGNGCPCTVLHLPENHHVEPTVYSYLRQKKISLVIQLRDKTRDFALRRQTEATAGQDYFVRRFAIDFNTPLITDERLAELLVDAISLYGKGDLEIEPYASYVPKRLY